MTFEITSVDKINMDFPFCKGDHAAGNDIRFLIKSSPHEYWSREIRFLLDQFSVDMTADDQMRFQKSL